MNYTFSIGKLFAVCIALGALVMTATPVLAKDKGTSFDGLPLVKVDEFDEVYMKQGFKFKDYDQVMLEQGNVTFKKNWAKDYYRNTGIRVKEDDILRIKKEASEKLVEVFEKNITKHQVFKITDKASKTTLLLKPSIIKLDVNAPDVRSSATRQKNYVREAGEATLYLEVYDSLSGEILARVIDRQKARDYGYLHYANRVTNSAEARRMFKQWANRLHEQLVKSGS